ncbi:MAG: FHA domain-containing protein [Polyangiales bacterium]
MSRFRLRFLLQEFDLPPGDTLIGRSPECQITIEDPLISRQHGRIIVQGGIATFVDLGSRNGSRVNGRPVGDPVLLVDGDRVRLGAQELVFLKVDSDPRAIRATGAMRLCSRCKTPFPEGPQSCPHCGHSITAVTEEDTVSGIGVPVRRGWILQMLGEVLERALRTEKLSEADRLLKRAAEETEDRLRLGEIDAAQLSRIAEYALQLARLKSDPRWATWVLEMHRRAVVVPSSAVVEGVGNLLQHEELRVAARDFLTFWADRDEVVSPADAPQLTRLERLLEDPTQAD